MKVISFSDTEINELLVYYQNELVKANERLNYVNGIIKKLNSDMSKIPENEEVTLDSKLEPETNTKTLENNKQNKPEKELEPEIQEDLVVDLSKIDLNNFLISTLKKRDCLITNADFVDIATDCYKLNNIPKIEISRKIANAMMKLVKNQEIMKIRIPGNQNFLYALPSWFGTDNKLKDKYLI